ncbi:carbohydrate-binding module family 66 protein [Xylaria nigripes]|nr:carbohydrate-binding module family 66 protein [Xylaria nigripes]
MLSLPRAIFGVVLPMMTQALPSISPSSLDFPTAVAGNPFVPGWYADPDIEYYDERFWVFSSISDAYENQTHLDAFSSPDLIKWEEHKRILSAFSINWVKKAIWAPAPISRHGKYYLYFGANDLQEDEAKAGVLGGIGVAVANRPQGPYEDAIGRPLIGRYHHGAQPIDQDVFLDDDNQAYIFYGGHSHCNMAKLNRDMISLGQFDDGDTFKEITPEGYVEGVQMIKRERKYYLMWSEGVWTGPDYRVSYAMSDSVMGPFIKKGTVLQQNPTVAKGTGHNSVIHIPHTDIWYIFYHRRPLSEKDGNHRVLAYDRMYFNEDGTIKPVEMLVQDDFSDRRTLAWKDYGQSWSAFDGLLTSSGHGVALLDTNFGNLVYNATILIANRGAHAGLLFRMSGASNLIAELNGYYAKLTGGESHVTVEKINKGEHSVLGQGNMTNVLDSKTTLNIQVRAVGPEISVYVSDMQTPKVTVYDSSFSTGQNGVAASAERARFGHVSVAESSK